MGSAAGKTTLSGELETGWTFRRSTWTGTTGNPAGGGHRHRSGGERAGSLDARQARIAGGNYWSTLDTGSPEPTPPAS
ncbi:hypothetical protein GCM10009854_32490 [Saccharopolyspora halophila]|uniref:Uncharacterized protein n=1 Tax=Saccharopolyspora halophila TaxID=405551 RepID=A0ABN3GI15_9PSEU